MLSKEENEFLTRIGPGTPMGELFRRFWLPAMLSSEVEADAAPIRLRLLCEDLIGFRDTSGKAGILVAYCAHKLAHLFWGRNEEQGLRCTYHGWKYDIEGNCVDMPNEPADSNFKGKIKLRSYPTREQGGVVWIYMGPPEKEPPELPQLEWLRVPEEQSIVSKWLQRTNWAQGMEGEIDSSHTGWLHFGRGPLWSPDYAGPTQRGGAPDQPRARAQRDGAPKLTLRETPYGFTYSARRGGADGNYYWRITRWMYPFYSLIPAQSGNIDAGKGSSGRCWVPIDDEHTWTFGYACIDRPYTQAEREYILCGSGFPPRVTWGTYTLKDGYKIDTWLPVATRDNDYMVDWDLKRYGNFTGIYGINEQDRSIQESMKSIVDRTREHLGTSDLATIAARRLLIQMARQLQEGIEPGVVQQPDLYRLRAIDVVDTSEAFVDVLAKHEAELGVSLH